MERAEAAAVAPMNIYQRLNEVRKAVPYLQKDKQVGSGGWGYKAITHDAVTRELREHLITQGVMIVPHRAQGAAVLTGTTTGKGIPIIRYEAVYNIDFVNVDDPQDRVTVEMEAHALDEGDKAPGKAVSYATKYAMLKLFSIETGEDDEDRHDAKGRRKDSERIEDKIHAADVKPNAGAGESLSKEEKAGVERVASEVIDCFSADQPETAFDVIEEAALDVDRKLFLWTFLDSKQRSALKKIAKARKEATMDRETAGQA